MMKHKTMIRRSALSLATAATLALPVLAGDSDPWVFDDSQHPVPAPVAVSTAVSAPMFIGQSAEASVGASSTAFDTRIFTDAVSAVYDFVTRLGLILVVE